MLSQLVGSGRATAFMTHVVFCRVGDGQQDPFFWLVICQMARNHNRNGLWVS